MNKETKPDCKECVHRRNLPGSCHSRCNNHKARVKGHAHGIKNGWFIWPLNFDPVWLVSCDGFSDNPKDNLKPSEVNPLDEILSILRNYG